MEKIRDTIVKHYKDEIISLYLYGSRAVGDEVEGISDYNFFLVLKNYKPSKALSINYPPFIFTIEEIYKSLDTFPIELLDIKERGRLLFGNDVLREISINDGNLKMQIERELKEKLINFRRVLNSFNENIPIFIYHTYKSLTSILRAILHIENLNKPLRRSLIYYEISKFLKINYNLFLKLEERNFSNLDEIVENFYNFLDMLCNKYS
ncbi:MAG: hypothetical protein N2504_02120 [candidate division WOR-3 bacterium]|nr:hypothetical protein [candidate division WOR-3 bacterium]MCX7947369.1 hypothetical protein [candidate division WOR-3 bacterium]MDW8150075.1 hypothetical protein [candidate division WOR-3 bacterium]